MSNLVLEIWTHHICFLWIDWLTDSWWPVYYQGGCRGSPDRSAGSCRGVCLWSFEDLHQEPQNGELLPIEFIEYDLMQLHRWRHSPCEKNVTLARRIYYLAQFHFQHGERLGFVLLIWKIKRPMQVLRMISQGFYKAFQTGSHVPSGFSRIISSNLPHERNANRQSHIWFHLSPLHCLSVCMGNETPAEKFQRSPWNPCTEA